MDPSCTCHLGTCLDHGTAPPASAPVAVAPWPAWVGAIVEAHARLVRAGDILGAALHAGPEDNGLTTLRVRAKGGDPSEWPEDLRVREMPVRP